MGILDIAADISAVTSFLRDNSEALLKVANDVPQAVSAWGAKIGEIHAGVERLEKGQARILAILDPYALPDDVKLAAAENAARDPRNADRDHDLSYAGATPRETTE